LCYQFWLEFGYGEQYFCIRVQRRARLVVATCFLHHHYSVFPVSPWFFILAPELTYEIWHGFFANSMTKVFALLTLLSILVHAWIGLYQILTDYVKLLAVRLVSQLAIVIVLLVYLLYATIVVCGV